MQLELKDLLGAGVAIVGIVVAYLRFKVMLKARNDELKSQSDEEKGKVSQKLESMSEKLDKLEGVDVLTKNDCSNCVERVKMSTIEQCVAKLERIVSKNEEKQNEFIKNLSAFMGGVKKFMEIHSETLAYYREQKLASRVERLEKTVGQ